MTARVLPTEPGWWWASLGGGEPQAVQLLRESGGMLYTCIGPWCVTHEQWTWLEPVAPPGTVARLEAEVASLAARNADFEKYTKIMCPDCGAPTDGLPEGWPA